MILDFGLWGSDLEGRVKGSGFTLHGSMSRA
jgi:hypothetical protein